jgi:DNA topoisomerase I
LIGKLTHNDLKDSMNVVIVESPAKAKTINKYLGANYKVLASYGHVRDLLAKEGSVETENDFAMHWETDGRAVKVMKEIVDAVKGADKVILATDPDREGEAISWHILEVLLQKRAIKKGVPVERVAFNAITKSSVTTAMANPRDIDTPLVEAYLARRALDFLVGFKLSPVLWRRLPGAKSAGRVQSVALRIVCDREAEILAFKNDEYWTIEAQLKTAKAEDLTARLVAVNGTTLKKLDIKDEVSATAIKAAIENSSFKISSVDKKPTKRNPYAPFTTSTMQMDASRRLGLDAKQAMSTAQRLYEGIDIGGETVGLITYMRTDGVDIIPEAVAEIRKHITSEFGANYTPIAREYKSKAKNAQEAHEAIRPTDPARTPDQMKKFLDKEQAALYDLIWKRTIASQMAPAEMEQTTVNFDCTGRDGKAYGLRTTGSIVTFDGFLKVYEEARDEKDHATKGKDDAADSEDEGSKRLPMLAAGDTLKDKQIDADQHFTQPPPRFTEASLVKRMEELGIGRPSTFASTMAVLRDRDYVRMEQKKLVPEDKGRLVTGFLKSFFTQYVEYDFTADLEGKLDLISDDKLAYKDVLRDFWLEFAATIAETMKLSVTQVLDTMNDELGATIFPPKEDGSDARACPICGNGRLSLKVGKLGAFIGCSNYEKDGTGCKFTRSFADTTAGADGATPDGRLIGEDPETGLPVTLRSGRFGTYLQLGEQSKDKDADKPRRSSIPKGIDAATIDLEQALNLLRLPRDVGLHPETQTMITAGLGRFGPFIKHDGKFANVETIEDVFTIGLNRAVTVLAEKAAGGGKSGFQRAAPVVLKEVGAHPDDGAPIQVFTGKYGPYVKWTDVNATIPKSQDPLTLTVQQAVDLIVERIAKGGIKVKKKKAAPAKKAASKSAAKASDNGDAPKKKAPAKAKAKAKAPAKAPAKKKSSAAASAED